ncbi:uncharacterized protein PGTG_16591 [Puccinia graminis f. sp. tritici CRL 75-36-700-3]|uniref:Amino acid permease/ SLC12A domain-containing protein n=1 Tax=Puccinia graminis f. sp. tritici (strain CRL 75-36-700-3 / race SCCL) TaxID=418459 RepID=E3L1Z0_PUCGT|nr:uncharacterized protein PGTG_16591 [Puccinia graminis f. sp. tritici CRL 75-36-700-3]EFP90565.2 hypothetical protein PGTG_16591 [Puccinia graminis f. sp. tritici CRL 75-36-700-3]
MTPSLEGNVSLESKITDDDTPSCNGRTTLQTRHVYMMAIGGTIGTGLFSGSGEALRNGGPVGLLLGHLVVGVVVYSMIVALGEMVTVFPVGGSAPKLPSPVPEDKALIHYPARFVDPALAFACGRPDHDRIGFRYWISPGPFNQFNEIPGFIGRFLAFWSVLSQAAFTHQGTEIVALAALETENPRKSIPIAIKTVLYRILIFYLGGMTVVGLLVPYTSSSLGTGARSGALSPFVIAFNSVHIPTLSMGVSIIAVMIISVFPVVNSHIYAGSKILHGLSSDDLAPLLFSRAPKWFSRYTSNGDQVAGIAITAVFGLLAYTSVAVGISQADTVYERFSKMSSISVLMTWWSILLTYIQFYHGVSRKVGIDRGMFAYQAPFQPWLSYFGFSMTTLIIIFNGFEVFLSHNWSTSKFISAYISLLIFPLGFIWSKISRKTSFVKLDQMKLEEGRSELNPLDVMEGENDVNSVGKFHKFLHWILKFISVTR